MYSDSRPCAECGAEVELTPHTSPKEDKADQESEQSFPASDPPANY